MDPLLHRQRIAVRTDHDQVVLEIGNAAVKMDYHTALKLSTWLKYRGKEAKRFAGDISKHWHVIAELGDAEEHDKKGWR